MQVTRLWDRKPKNRKLGSSGCWFVVYIRRFIYKYLNVCPFGLHGCCGEWEGGPVNQVNHNSWVAVVTPTDRPKSVRNRGLIELFCGVVCVVTLPFWHFCWCRGFCHRTGSDLLFFVFQWHVFRNRILSGYFDAIKIWLYWRMTKMCLNKTRQFFLTVKPVECLKLACVFLWHNAQLFLPSDME